MANPSLLTDWVARQGQRWLDLWLMGLVFGGRPGESPLVITNCEIDGARVHLTFDHDERLTVVGASGFLTADGGLTIPRADEVRFGWYYYGRPQSAENWSETRYVRDGERVSITTTGPSAKWRPPSEVQLDKQPMVRLT